MINENLYLTPEERMAAYFKFCSAHDCEECPVFVDNENSGLSMFARCAFHWLKREADAPQIPEWARPGKFVALGPKVLRRCVVWKVADKQPDNGKWRIICGVGQHEEFNGVPEYAQPVTFSAFEDSDAVDAAFMLTNIRVKRCGSSTNTPTVMRIAHVTIENKFVYVHLDVASSGAFHRNISFQKLFHEYIGVDGIPLGKPIAAEKTT